MALKKKNPYTRPTTNQLPEGKRQSWLNKILGLWFQFGGVLDLPLNIFLDEMGLAIRKPEFESQLHHKLNDSGPVTQAMEPYLQT